MITSHRFFPVQNAKSLSFFRLSFKYLRFSSRNINAFDAPQAEKFGKNTQGMFFLVSWIDLNEIERDRDFFIYDQPWSFWRFLARIFANLGALEAFWNFWSWSH